MAQEFKLTGQLVHVLVKEAEKGPEKLGLLRQQEQESAQKRQAIEETVTERLVNNMAIARAQQVQAAVSTRTGLEVSLPLVRKTMRKELGMGYRKAATVPVQANSERCLVLRQQYALRMFPLLESGRRIINVDESWLSQTRFVRRMWAPADSPATVTDK